MKLKDLKDGERLSTMMNLESRMQITGIQYIKIKLVTKLITACKKFLYSALAQVSAEGRHVQLVPTVTAVSDRKDLETQVSAKGRYSQLMLMMTAV